MTNCSYDRFAKWQSIMREQLSVTSNLILGLSTGLLAFIAALLIQHKSNISSCALGFGAMGSFFLACSISLALWCAMNRLKDFRLTAKIANPKHHGCSTLDEWRDESNRLGERTWDIFRGQIWSFSIGAGGVVVSLVIQVFS